MKIMIIEDEGITRQWLKKKLEEIPGDYQVEGVFSNGKAAIDYLTEGKEADVIFTDIRMPVMDGLEVLEKLLEMGHTSYKVILSAYDEFQYARQAMRLGAQEFVLKPEITKEALQKILQDAAVYLAQRRPQKEQKETKQPGNERGMAFASLMKQEGAGTDELAEVFGCDGDLQDLAKLVIVDIYMERQDTGETISRVAGNAASKATSNATSRAGEELLDLFLEQEQIRGAFFRAGNQSIILGYLHDTEAERADLMGRLSDILHIHTGMNLYLGISRMQGDGNLMEMYRQAAAARENRVFFGLPGAWQYDDMRVSMNQEPGELYFNQDIKEITKYLEEANYDGAAEKLDGFLDNVKKASYLHPAYVKALCDEILSAYRHSLWEYVLNEEEKERVGGARFLMGRETFDLKQLIDAVKNEVDYLCGLLQEKRGKGQYSSSVEEVMRYVDEHLGERISLEQMADTVFLSKPYLSTLFKKETGKKFSSYLQEVRLERSRVMLKDSRLSVGEIAEQVGFFDSAHFSRVFKEHYGCSPLEYRKMR